jgi:uncharacterized membrane protein
VIVRHNDKGDVASLALRLDLGADLTADEAKLLEAWNAGHRTTGHRTKSALAQAARLAETTTWRVLRSLQKKGFCSTGGSPE